jgi:hypothetical protein
VSLHYILKIESRTREFAVSFFERRKQSNAVIVRSSLLELGHVEEAVEVYQADLGLNNTFQTPLCKTFRIIPKWGSLMDSPYS